MDYTKCSTPELKGFVEARRLVVPKDTDTASHARARRTYIKRLEKADTEQTFHGFLNLPPELRDIVYRWLLNTGDLKTWKAQLSRTCKNVKDEVTKFIYRENMFEMKIGWDRITFQGVTYGRLDLNFPERVMRRHWPKFLYKVTRLRIELSASESDPFEKLPLPERKPNMLSKMLRNVLHLLCTFLSNKHNKLRVLQLQLPLGIGPGRIPHEEVRTMCYPLRMLNLLSDIQVPGLQEQLVQGILTDLEDARPYMSFWRTHDAVLAKVKLCAEMIRSFDVHILPLTSPLKLDHSMSAQLHKLRWIVKELESLYRRTRRPRSGYFDKEWEDDCLDYVEKLRLMLASLDLDQLGQAIEQMHKATNDKFEEFKSVNEQLKQDKDGIRERQTKKR